MGRKQAVRSTRGRTSRLRRGRRRQRFAMKRGQATSAEERRPLRAQLAGCASFAWNPRLARFCTAARWHGSTAAQRYALRGGRVAIPERSCVQLDAARKIGFQSDRAHNRPDFKRRGALRLLNLRRLIPCGACCCFRNGPASVSCHIFTRLHRGRNHMIDLPPNARHFCRARILSTSTARATTVRRVLRRAQ